MVNERRRRDWLSAHRHVQSYHDRHSDRSEREERGYDDGFRIRRGRHGESRVAKEVDTRNPAQSHRRQEKRRSRRPLDGEVPMSQAIEDLGSQFGVGHQAINDAKCSRRLDGTRKVGSINVDYNSDRPST